MAKRDEYLKETLERAERELTRLPVGKVNHQKGNIWRYSGPENFRTIHGPDSELLEKLVLRSYLEKLCRAAEAELKARKRYRKNQPSVKMEEIYDSLSEYRKEIIQPFVPTMQQKIDEWLNQPYPSFNPIPLDDRFPTGIERIPYVRSKSEIMEVREMDNEGMAVLYEFPLVVVDLHGKKRTFYPDFTILNKKTMTVVYWEHFGRMDDPGYFADFKRKQEIYANNGLLGCRLYETFESSAHPLTLTEVRSVIEDLKKRCG